MSSDRAGAAIEALRERGAHQFDPIRFRFIEALARRAQAYGGDARQLLDGRLAKLLADYAEHFDRARSGAGAAIDLVGVSEDSANRSALAGLVDQLDRHRPAALLDPAAHGVGRALAHRDPVVVDPAHPGLCRERDERGSRDLA